MKAYKLWFRLIKKYGMFGDVTAEQMVDMFHEYAFEGMTNQDRNRLVELINYKIQPTLPVNDSMASIKNGERDKLRQAIVGDKLQIDDTSTTIEETDEPPLRTTLFTIPNKIG